MSKRILIALFCLLTTVVVLAQEQAPPPLLFKRLTVSKGLSQASNYFFYKDSKGFMWISSISGLNRFDGINNKIYRESIGDSTSIKGANINGHFFEDASSNIWFSTYNAINAYIRAEGNFRSYTLKDSLGSNLIGYFTCGLDDDGNLWLIHKSALYKFNIHQKKFNFICKTKAGFQNAKTELSKNGKIKRVYLYDGTKGIHIISFKNDEVINQQSYFSKRSKHTSNPAIKIEEVLPESDTLIWLATSDGILNFNPTKETFESHQYLNKTSIESTPIDILAADHYDDDNLILTIKREGITFFNKKHKTYSPFQSKIDGIDYSIIRNSLQAIYVDDNKSVWANASGLSVEYAAPHKLKFNNYLSNAVIKSIFKLSNGDTWIGSLNNNNYILNPQNKLSNQINCKTQPKLCSNNFNYHFEDDDKRVWLLGWRGLAYYDLTSQEVALVETKQGLNLAYLFGAILRDGRTIFSTAQGGLYTLLETGEKVPKLELIKEVPASNAYTIFYQSKSGNIYANENLNRMVVFDQQFNVLKTVPIEADLKCFYEAPNDSLLWIGTDRGLVRYNKLNSQFKYITEDDGLPNAMVYGIIPDHENNFWLSTNAGLAKYNPQNGFVHSYNIYDGITHPEYNTHAYFKKDNGEIMFGSMGGITAFNPKNFKQSPYKHQPLITSLKINDEVVTNLACAKTGATNVSEIKALSLPYKDNTISFEFSALDFGDASKNQYRYQLVGEDKDLIESGTRDFVRYSNLKPKAYQFQLFAANSDGVWCEAPTLLDVNIIPPVWMRTWFKVVLGLLLIGLLWLVSRLYYKYKYDKQLALEQQKIFWARKMHEDLGADYSSLKLRLGMLFSKLGKTKDSDRILQLTDTISKQIRGITWSLNYKNDTLSKLINYLQEDAKSRFEDTSIQLHFPLPEAVPEKLIKGEIRMTVLHLFKEALNNVQKHSQANIVTVKWQNFANSVEINIEDNGIGFELQEQTTSNGNGLTNMKERMNEIGGNCIISSDSAGTKVLFSFPI